MAQQQNSWGFWDAEENQFLRIGRFLFLFLFVCLFVCMSRISDKSLKTLPCCLLCGGCFSSTSSTSRVYHGSSWSPRWSTTSLHTASSKIPDSVRSKRGENFSIIFKNIPKYVSERNQQLPGTRYQVFVNNTDWYYSWAVRESVRTYTCVGAIRRESTRGERADVFSRNKNESTNRTGEGGGMLFNISVIYIYLFFVAPDLSF